MKLSQLKGILDEAFERTPSEMSIIFGYDCGCGGDEYYEEDWNEEHEQIEKAREKLIRFCEEYDIEIDAVFGSREW